MTEPAFAPYTDTPRWWLETGKARATAIVALVEDLERAHATLGDRALNAICLYEGRQMPSLHPLAYYKAGAFSGDNFDQLTWNIPRSLAQTVQAKIAGVNRTKVNFVVTDGDWGQKRRAKRLDRFVEGQFYAPQGAYADAWQLMQRICLDALIIPGGGFAKVTANYEEKHVQLERAFSWELFVDPDDARCGAPRTLVHRFAHDADAILERFPEAKDALWSARRAEDPAQDLRATMRAVKQIWVYEAWRLGSPAKPGVHTLCIDGHELFEEEWSEDRFPIVRLTWAQETLGWGAQSLVEEVAVLNDELNHTLQRMQEGERKTNAVIMAAKGSVDAEAIESNEIAKVVEFDPNMPAPTYNAPPGFSDTTLQWLQLNKAAMFELPGVSQMAATSRKEPGIESAVAIRTMQDVQTERFSVFERAYETAFVDLARLIVAAVRQLAEESGEDITAKWHSGSFLKKIDWSACNLDEDQYVIRPDPVSGIKNTSADRLQLAQDLMQAGVLAPDAFARVVQYLDTPGEFGRVNKQREWVESQIEAWLDATPAAEDSGAFTFHPPIKFMVLEDALLQVVEAYFSALVDGAPDYNLSFFLQWMEFCDKELQERAARAQALAAPPPLAPPPATMAGSPAPPVGA